MDVAVTFSDVLANAKKAVVGGLAAAAAAVVPLGVASYLNDYKIDAPEANALIAAGVIAFGGAVGLVYNVKNKPLTGVVKKETGEAAPDAGVAPEPSSDDTAFLAPLSPADDTDTSDIEPVTDGDDGLEEDPKHLA